MSHVKEIREYQKQSADTDLNYSFHHLFKQSLAILSILIHF